MTIKGHSAPGMPNPIITDTTLAGIGTYSAGARSRTEECQIEVDGHMSIDDNVDLTESKLDIREGCSAQINNIFLDEEIFEAKDVRVVGHNKDHSVALLAHHDSRHPNSVYIHEGGVTHRFRPTAGGNYEHDKSFGESPFEGVASKNKGYMGELAHAARKYNSSVSGR